MNRVWLSTAVGLAVVVGVMVNMQEVLSADQAVVSKAGGPCGIFAGPAGGVGEISMVLENTNKVMMKCKGTGLVNPTGNAQSADGFLCGIVTEAGQLVVTEDSHATVSASGVGSMTCTYRK